MIISQNKKDLKINNTEKIILEKNPKEEITVETLKAEGQKCNICWKITKGKCERCSNL